MPKHTRLDVARVLGVRRQTASYQVRRWCRGAKMISDYDLWRLVLRPLGGPSPKGVVKKPMPDCDPGGTLLAGAVRMFRDAMEEARRRGQDPNAVSFVASALDSAAPPPRPRT